MANLNGQNIGLNYKGFLNLDSTINTPLDTTLRSVTDGMGTLSPLQLSTTQVAVLTSADSQGFSLINGSTTYFSIKQDGASPRGEMFLYNGGTPFIRFAAINNSYYNGALFGIGLTSGITARLHVRGDGTNPIARFEDNSGNLRFSINASNNVFCPAIFYVDSIQGYTSNAISLNASISSTIGTTITSGTFSNYAISSSFNAATGSGNYRPISLAYTINNSGAQSGTATGIYSRAMETALNGMLHNLIDLGTTGLGSLFSVTNKGAIKVASLANADAPNSSLYFSTDASRLVWKDAGGTVNNLY